MGGGGIPCAVLRWVPMLPTVLGFVTCNYLPTLASLTPEDRGDLLLYVCLGLTSLIAAAAGVGKVYEAFFKRRGNQTEAITRAEFDGFRQLVHARFVETDSRFDKVNKELGNLIQSLNSELRSINRSLGKLDGRLSQTGGPSTVPTSHDDE